MAKPKYTEEALKLLSPEDLELYKEFQVSGQKYADEFADYKIGGAAREQTASGKPVTETLGTVPSVSAKKPYYITSKNEKVIRLKLDMQPNEDLTWVYDSMSEGGVRRLAGIEGYCQEGLSPDLLSEEDYFKYKDLEKVDTGSACQFLTDRTNYGRAKWNSEYQRYIIKDKALLAEGGFINNNPLESLLAFIMVPLMFLFWPAVILLLKRSFLKRREKKRMEAILQDHLPLSSFLHLERFPLDLYLINEDATLTLYGKLVEKEKPFNYSFRDNVKEYSLIDKGDIFIIGDFQQSLTDGFFYHKVDRHNKLYIKSS
jgi:hypothetical protein